MVLREACEAKDIGSMLKDQDTPQYCTVHQANKRFF